MYFKENKGYMERVGGRRGNYILIKKVLRIFWTEYDFIGTISIAKSLFLCSCLFVLVLKFKSPEVYMTVKLLQSSFTTIIKYRKHY